MIVLPAIPAIVSALTPILQAALVSAGIGAAIGGASAAVGEVVTGVHEHGAINHVIVESAVHSAANGAAEGALVGGAFGAVGVVVAPVVAPAIQVVDDVARSVMQVADDAARPMIQAADDAARPLIQAADDAIRPALNGIRNRAKAFGGSVNAAFNHARNSLNARFYTRLPKGAGNNGYVYVMDDVANTGRYKIGKTIDPAKRIKAVRNDLNKSVGGKVDYACIIPTNNMSGLETSLHKKYAAQNLRNFPAGTEWFMLNSAQLAAACSR